MSEENIFIGEAKDHVIFKNFPEYDDWECYLFGSDNGNGLVYRPLKGKTPNFVVRFLMHKLLGCRWAKL